MGVPDSPLCCYLGDGTQDGIHPLPDMCTHTSSPSNIRESAPKVGREGRGGSTGQSDISSWVLATVWKCHIIQPDTSIKVWESFLTVDSKRIITLLHHPLCLALCTTTTFLFLFFNTHEEMPSHVKMYTFSHLILSFSTNKSQPKVWGEKY